MSITSFLAPNGNGYATVVKSFFSLSSDFFLDIPTRSLGC